MDFQISQVPATLPLRLASHAAHVLRKTSQFGCSLFPDGVSRTLCPNPSTSVSVLRARTLGWGFGTGFGRGEGSPKPPSLGAVPGIGDASAEPPAGHGAGRACRHSQIATSSSFPCPPRSCDSSRSVLPCPCSENASEVGECTSCCSPKLPAMRFKRPQFHHALGSKSKPPPAPRDRACGAAGMQGWNRKQEGTQPGTINGARGNLMPGAIFLNSLRGKPRVSGGGRRTLEVV